MGGFLLWEAAGLAATAAFFAGVYWVVDTDRRRRVLSWGAMVGTLVFVLVGLAAELADGDFGSY